MKKLITMLLILAASSAFAAKDTIHVDGHTILSANDEKLVFRGYNEMFVWSSDKTGEIFIPEMAKSGANTVRLVWDHAYGNEDQLVTLIERTLQHKMIAVPECHNATGKWGADLQACVDFWNNPTLIDGIQKNRQWTILNIANEAGNHDISDEMFLTFYKAAVTSLRSWGYTVPIMIDATTWGQNLDQLIRTGSDLLKHDPLNNIIFSTHSYWPAEITLENYQKVIDKSQELGIAIIIGEGPSVTRVGQCEDPNPLPYLEGMKMLEEAQVGWLNWSWGGMKNGDCDDYRYFDHTDGGIFGKWMSEPGAKIVATSPYSVMQTSKRPASFYEDGKVRVSGIYIDVEKTSLNVGESAKFQVLLAPINAENTQYELSVKNKKLIELDLKTNTLKAIKKGETELVAKSKEGDIVWRTPVKIQ